MIGLIILYRYRIHAHRIKLVYAQRKLTSSCFGNGDDLIHNPTVEVKDGNGLLVYRIDSVNDDTIVELLHTLASSKNAVTYVHMPSPTPFRAH